MLDRYSSKTRRYLETLIHHGGASSPETYMCKHKCIGSLSVLSQFPLYFYLLEFTQTLWNLAYRMRFTKSVEDFSSLFLHWWNVNLSLHNIFGVNETCLTRSNTLFHEYLNIEVLGVSESCLTTFNTSFWSLS